MRTVPVCRARQLFSIDSFQTPGSAAVLPIDYLQEIENASFPLEEADAARIKCVELLCAVGYLQATVSAAINNERRARVALITWQGRTALASRRSGVTKSS